MRATLVKLSVLFVLLFAFTSTPWAKTSFNEIYSGGDSDNEYYDDGYEEPVVPKKKYKKKKKKSKYYKTKKKKYKKAKKKKAKKTKKKKANKKAVYTSKKESDNDTTAIGAGTNSSGNSNVNFEGKIGSGKYDGAYIPGVESQGAAGQGDASYLTSNDAKSNLSNSGTELTGSIANATAPGSGKNVAEIDGEESQLPRYIIIGAIILVIMVYRLRAGNSRHLAGRRR